MTVFMLPSWWEKSQTSWTLERHPDNLRKSTWPGLGSGNVDEVGGGGNIGGGGVLVVVMLMK